MVSNVSNIDHLLRTKLRRTAVGQRSREVLTLCIPSILGCHHLERKELVTARQKNQGLTKQKQVKQVNVPRRVNQRSSNASIVGITKYLRMFMSRIVREIDTRPRHGISRSVCF